MPRSPGTVPAIIRRDTTDAGNVAAVPANAATIPHAVASKTPHSPAPPSAPLPPAHSFNASYAPYVMAASGTMPSTAGPNPR